jgi:ABC-type transporter Mla subunit MlaD
MSFANVNVGTTASDGTGDPLRLAFTKINTNFANIASGQVTSANIAYTAGNSLNWNYTVTNVQDALDQLAYRLKQAGF